MVDDQNQPRYRETFGNLMRASVYRGRGAQILKADEKFETWTDFQHSLRHQTVAQN